MALSRDEAGVVHIQAETLDDALMGLGFAHARDRGLQMLLMRIIGRGEASELLRADEESLALDRFFRALNFRIVHRFLLELRPRVDGGAVGLVRAARTNCTSACLAVPAIAAGRSGTTIGRPTVSPAAIA